jgi:hypothetical protein
VAALGSAVNPLLGIVGFGVGQAMGPALRPPIQDLINEAWTLHPSRPFSADTAAAMWVEGVWTPDRAKQEGAYVGIDGDRMNALRDLIDDPPDAQTLMALWRRGLISGDKFIEGLRHLRIETDYFEALRQTHDVLLTPEQVANARQRNFMTRAEQYAEAALQGVTNDRAEVQFELSGLPPPPDRAREMWRRGIIGETEFRQAIVEGNEKLKYVDEEVALFRPLLTPAQIVNQRLRGWRDTAWMDERLSEHGFSAEQANDLFEGQGRPVAFRQVFIGQRRGGEYNGPTGGIDPAILKALQESNIRPEWYNLADAQKESYPSGFVIRGLAQSGDITPEVTRRLLLGLGWPEFLIDAVVGAWTGGGGTGGGALVKSARTQAVTEIRNAYLIGQADEGQARGWLDAIGVAAADTDGMIPIWNVMREVPQRGLTAAQIKKAYSNLAALWPRSRALDELALLGYTADDAATLLDE